MKKIIFYFAIFVITLLIFYFNLKYPIVEAIMHSTLIVVVLLAAHKISNILDKKNNLLRSS